MVTGSGNCVSNRQVTTVDIAMIFEGKKITVLQKKRWRDAHLPVYSREIVYVNTTNVCVIYGPYDARPDLRLLSS